MDFTGTCLGFRGLGSYSSEKRKERLERVGLCCKSQQMTRQNSCVLMKTTGQEMLSVSQTSQSLCALPLSRRPTGNSSRLSRLPGTCSEERHLMHCRSYLLASCRNNISRLGPYSAKTARLQRLPSHATRDPKMLKPEPAKQ